MKKKKKSKAAQQTQLLMEQAAIKKRFYVNLKEACRLMVGPDFYSKLTPSQLEEVFRYRIYGIKVKAAEGNVTPKTIIQEITGLVPVFFQNNFLDTATGKDQINLELYYEVGLSMVLYCSILKDDEHPNVAYLKEAIARYDIDGDIAAKASKQMFRILVMFGILTSDLKKCFCYFTHTWTPSNVQGKTNHEIHIHEYLPEQISISIDESSRPIYRVFLVNPHGIPDYVFLKPSILGLPHDGNDTPLNVYIQSHALQRMEERIGVNTGYMQYFMVLSLHFPIIHKETEEKYLIEFIFLDKKIGYLVATIIENKVIILTFLFLTNNGTPEGKKLAALTGLDKLDKKYLAIDKLKSFVKSDIKKHEKIKTLFIEAGCGSLFELEESDFYFVDKTNETNAELVMKYLNLQV